jgi:hypothetical protein
MKVAVIGAGWQYGMERSAPNETRRTGVLHRCVEVKAMAGDGGIEGKGFVARLSDVFARELFQPMFQKAPVAASEVRQLIAEIRRKLDALDEVITTAEPGASALPSTAARVASLAASFDAADGGTVADGDEYDDIGRNQRSRLRELVLLEAMARETRPYSLQQLLAALNQKSFADTSGAVVSQLHRLKKLGLINQPANGMYEITLDGLGHLRKLRSSFGALIGEAR